jgi:hypothetical protein
MAAPESGTRWPAPQPRTSALDVAEALRALRRAKPYFLVRDSWLFVEAQLEGYLRERGYDPGEGF